MFVCKCRDLIAVTKDVTCQAIAAIMSLFISGISFEINIEVWIENSEG